MTFPEREFETFNNRIFYACQAVLVNRQGGAATGQFGRNTLEDDYSTAPTTGFLLEGVQSVGVSQERESTSLQDVGRFQRMYHYFGKQLFTINIERVISDQTSFFYEIASSDYAAGEEGYRTSHILHENNIGTTGTLNNNNKVLRNYDITLLYSSDNFRGVGAAIHLDADPSTEDPDEFPDAKSLDSITYRSCVVTNISYSIGIDGSVTESITLLSRMATRNDEVDVTAYVNLPEGWITDNPRVPQSGSTLKKQDFMILPPVLSPDSYESILPYEVLKMFSSVDKNDNHQFAASYDPITNSMVDKRILGLQSIEIDIGINYNEINDIGMWRGSVPNQAIPEEGFSITNDFVELPIQVTVSFTGVARQQYLTKIRFEPGAGEYGFPFSDTTFSKTDRDSATPARLPSLDATEDDREWNRVDRKIRLAAAKRIGVAPTETISYYVMDFGARNYLTSIETSGGDVSGSNVEVTMTYQNDCSDVVLVKATRVLDLTYPDLPY